MHCPPHTLTGFGDAGAEKRSRGREPETESD